MAFPVQPDLSAGTTPFNAFSSALRYGIIDVKPIEYRRRIKRHGVKLIEQGILLERERREIKTPEDHSSEFISVVLSRIKIPERFQADKIKQILVKEYIDDLNKDPELLEFFERMDESKSREESTKSLQSFIEFMTERYEQELPEYIDAESERFLNSDLPLDFFIQFVSFEKMFMQFMRILNKAVTSKWKRLSTKQVRNDIRLFNRHFSQLKNRINSLIDPMDDAVLSLSSLKMYIKINNAENYSEITEPVFIRQENLDKEELKKLEDEFRQDSGEIAEIVLGESRERTYQLESGDDAIRLFKEISTQI